MPAKTFFTESTTISFSMADDNASSNDSDAIRKDAVREDAVREDAVAENAVGHDPVLMDQILAAIFAEPLPKIVVDCTLGRGGHTIEIARRLTSADRLISLDADPRNLEFARGRIADAGLADRVTVVRANFADLDSVLDDLQIESVDAILADLGVSTNQIFDSSYGLSFAADTPLDMRLDPDLRTTAADLVNKLDEKSLADLIYQLADERHSRRIARRIAEARRISPITTTGRLAEIVRGAVPRSRSAWRGKGAARPGRSPEGRRFRPAEPIDPATRTFLALRMKVNRETENLHTLIQSACKRLSPQGRLAIISFQSTEDRIVKHEFRRLHEAGLLEVVTRKPIEPDPAEVAANPRSRSAKLRVARRPQSPQACDDQS